MKKDLKSREKRLSRIGAIGMSLIALLAGILKPVLEKTDGAPLPLILTALLIAAFVCFLVIMTVKSVRIDREKAAARREEAEKGGAQPPQVRPGAQPPQVRPGGSAPQSRSGGSSAPDRSGEARWKEQLDGFLAAGVIDRREYRELLKRRRR